MRWSPEATRDLKGITDYIRQDSEFYAKIVADKITGVGRRIEQFPEAGHIVPEINREDFRERFVYSYRVIYRIQGDVATIVAVAHGKRLLLESFADRFPKEEKPN